MEYFKKILVPVDFSINTDVAVKKAMELATPGITTISLFHVYDRTFTIGRPGNHNTSPLPHSAEQCAQVLEKLAGDIQNEKNIATTTRILAGRNVQVGIIDETLLIKPELIILGKKNQPHFFTVLNTVAPAKLSELTRCNVLTAKPGSINKRIQTVVLAVSNALPHKIRELLFRMNSNQTLDVHLLTTLQDNQQPDSQSASALLQWMKFIRCSLPCTVHHNIVQSNNKPLAMLRYAEKVDADVLIVNTNESHVVSWIRKRDITDMLKPASRLQVMSIHPN